MLLGLISSGWLSPKLRLHILTMSTYKNIYIRTGSLSFSIGEALRMANMDLCETPTFFRKIIYRLFSRNITVLLQKLLDDTQGPIFWGSISWICAVNLPSKLGCKLLVYSVLSSNPSLLRYSIRLKLSVFYVILEMQQKRYWPLVEYFLFMGVRFRHRERPDRGSTLWE